MGKTRNTGKLATQIQFDNSNNLVIGNSTSSSFNTSGSVNAIGGITGSIYGIGDPTSFSSSISSNLVSIQSITASNIARLSNLESKSASVDISVSSINTFTSSNTNTSLNSKTGSYATTGSNTFFGTQTYSGSVYIANDLIVQGSSSIQYISASSVSIGTNIVQLNTANPSVRYAGLTMIDSGSVGGSGSFLYDSLQDEFIFVHRGNGTNITSSHFVLGPETYDSLGNETYLTCNRLTKGTGKEHLIDSCIFDNGTTVCVNATLKVGADTTIGTRNITLAGYPTSICFGNGQLMYDNGAGGLALNGQSGIQFLTCATASLNLSSAGYLGIGTTTPCRELHAKGEILFQSRNALPVNNSMYRFIPRSTENAFEFQLMADDTSTEKTVWSVCRNAQTVTSFNILNSNVGIGTCAPESKLHMYNANNPLSIKIQRTSVPVFLSDVQLAGTTAGAVWSHNLENTSNGSVTWSAFGNTVYAGSAMILQSDTSTSFITLHTAASVNTVPTERLRITGPGTFGFNCTGVAARTMVVKGATGCYIVAEFIEPAGVHSAYIYPNKNSTNHISSDYMSGGTFLPLSLSGRENTCDFVLGTDGRSYFQCQLMVGAVGVAQQYFLDVQIPTGACVISGTPGTACTQNMSGIRVYNTASGTSNSMTGIWFHTGPHLAGIASGRCEASAGWGNDLRFYVHYQTTDTLNNSYEKMRLNPEGVLTLFGYGMGTLSTNSAGVISASDGRLKTKTRTIENGLCSVMQLQPTYYRWNECTAFHTEYEELGFIAQEVACVIPEASPEPEEEHKFKNYSDRAIIAMLTKGMQEQQCTINLLKSCAGIV